MERSLHNRVYVNPNFKGINDSLSMEQIHKNKTTHFNRHYLREMPNRETNTNDKHTLSNKRKIYVNPNFINGHNVFQSTQNQPIESAVHIETNENIKKEPNRQPLHRSKYSLVHNLKQNVVLKEQSKNGDVNKNTVAGSNQGLLYTKKPIQEVPLTRSRYCIVRKKRRSVTVDHKSENKLVISNSDLISCSNQLSSLSSFQSVKNIAINQLPCKIPEKIIKMKITRYKTIPVSHIKRSTVVVTKENKFIASPSRHYNKIHTRTCPSLISSNKSSTRFTKTTGLNKPEYMIKAASKINQVTEKSMLCSANKMKLLNAKFNINNIPCRLFTKYGKCLRQEQGNCKYLHNKKQVILCHKFLKGICHDNNCCLSHEPTTKKMPTCYFYLNGTCTKESCPYLHVKLSDKTKICQEFAKGYCESGDQCPFRHVNITQIKRKKKISINSSQRNSQNKVVKIKKIKKKYTEKCDSIGNMNEPEEVKGKDDEDCRYYKEIVDSDNSYESIKPTRCKLGTLPSFIQL